jgi:autotransporter translocation and assembly factor TamB
MKIPRSLLTAFFAVSILTATAFAADLTGNWKWTSVTKANGAAEVTAALVQKDGKLTGTVTGRQGPADITDATVNGNQVAFAVIRTSGEVTVTFKYTGQLNGDTITGSIEKSATKKDTPPTKTDWKATRIH